jgi:hypothetical protein
MSDQRKPLLTGGCQCGGIRYALYAPPDRAGVCFCRMCQKAVGGPFTAWANVRRDNFAWSRGQPSAFQSSSAAERGFCPRCGTPLYFTYTKRPGTISLSLGSLDTPSAVTLTEVHGLENIMPDFVSTKLAGLPSIRTGEGNPPEDLARITSYQHPDHDTPADWHPPP